MNFLQIGRKRFSEIVWGIIDEKVEDYPYERLERILLAQHPLRAKAAYKTGSVPYDDAVELYKVTNFFAPKVIVEVGTFIGVSTRTMREAAPSATIYTCDHSNDIDVCPEDSQLFQYPNTPSSTMFADLAAKGVKADLIYLDGRLTPQDFEPLGKIITENTVFVLDDFEGVEKGVANAMILENAGRLLVYPRADRKTAVLIPLILLQFVPQEMT